MLSGVLSFLPDKRIPVRVGFHLGTVQKNLLEADLSRFSKLPDQLVEQILQASAQMIPDKPADRIVIRRFLPLQQIVIPQIVPAALFDFSCGKGPLRIGIDHNLGHDHRICFRFSPFLRIGSVQVPVIQFVHDLVQKPDRFIWRDERFCFQRKNQLPCPPELCIVWL